MKNVTSVPALCGIASGHIESKNRSTLNHHISTLPHRPQVKRPIYGRHSLMLWTVFSIGLSACNSDGVEKAGTSSGPTSGPTDVTPDDPSNVVASKDSIAYLMDVINFHKKGTMGRGATVAIVDTGIATHTKDLSSRIAETSVYISTLSDNYKDRSGHGTNMASIIASTGEESGLVGMAPRADLMVIRSDRDEHPGIPYVSLVAKGIKFAANKNADIINLSLSTDSQTVINAIRYAVSKGSIVTIATGNNGRYNDPSKIAYEAGNYGKTAVAVTSLSPLDKLSLFAAPCDVANPKYCVTAPGERIFALDQNGHKTVVSGTSAATAVVSGGLALLRQYFPDLSAEEIVEIMLSTAQDLGDKGIDRIYGSGLVDFAAAMRPVGKVTVAALGAEMDFSGSTAAIGAAFGDSLTQVRALKSVPIKDSYGRDYNIDIQSSLTTSTRMDEFEDLDLLADMRVANARSDLGAISLAYSSIPDTPLTGLVEDDWFFAASFDLESAGMVHFASTNTQRDMGAKEYNFYSAQRDPMKSPFALTGDRFTSLSYHTEASIGTFKTRAEVIEQADVGLQNSHSIVSLGYESHRAGGFQANATLSMLNEQGAILGTNFSGVFGDINNTRSIAATLGATYQGEGYDLFVSGSMGKSSVDMKRAGLIADFQDVRFSQWNVGIGFASVFTKDDRLSFGFGQPVRIEDGKTVFFDDSKHDLRPSGRELNAEMSYRAEMDQTNIAASLLYGSNIGHIANQKDQFLGAVTVSWAF